MADQTAKVAGYSGTALAKKLGIKSGDVILLLNAPVNYYALFSDWPQNVTITVSRKLKKNFIHFFTSSLNQLEVELPKLQHEIEMDGMIWVSWPKKTSKVETDVNENMIRDCALALGLVDVKVCAVDEVWSGLKLVIRVKDR